MRYKRLIAFLTVLAIVFVPLFSFEVSALDDNSSFSPLSEITIDGKKYPVVYGNPDVNIFADNSVNEDDVVYAESSYTDNVTGEVYYYDPSTGIPDLPTLNEYTIRMVMTLPEKFSRGSIIDFRFDGLTIFSSYIPNSSKAFLSDGNGNYSTIFSLSDEEVEANYFFVSAQGIEAKGAFNTVDVSYKFKPTRYTANTGVSLVDIVTVSESSMLNSIIEWLKGIKDGITELPSKISNAFKSFFDDIKNTINNIKNWFDELAEKIKGFFNDLASKIEGFFNKLWNKIWWGNENGESEYTPPDISSKFDDVVLNLNAMIGKLKDFSDSLSTQGDEIAGYIQTGSTFVDKFLSYAPAPILMFLVFAVVFVVVRKVVGR